MRNFQETKDIFSLTLTNGAANGAGIAMDVTDYRHLVLALNSTSSAAMVINVQGSIQEAQPTWASAASPTNQWAYVQIINLDDQSTVNGTTGITLSGTDIAKMYEVNTNGIKWVNLIVSSYSAGQLYARLKPFEDTLA